VEPLRAVRLGEGIQLDVEALLADLAVDRCADLPPALDRPRAAEPLDRLDAAIERDPGHHLRMGEVAPWAAHLPDSLVGFLPRVLEKAEQATLQRPGLLGHLELVH